MTERFVALIFMAEPVEVDAASLTAALQNAYPALKSEDMSAQSKSPDNGFVVRVGGAPMTIRRFDRPAPVDRFEQAIATSIGWRSAREDIAAHGAHFVVAPYAPHTKKTAVAFAALTAATAGAIASMGRAVGVYWAAADHLVDIETFNKNVEHVASGAPAFGVWVKFMPIKGPESADGAVSTGFITAGVQAFVGREIEVEPTTLKRTIVGARAIGFLNYLLGKNVVVEDGDTIGVSDREQIRVSLADDNPYTGASVYRLAIENIELTEDVAAETAPPPSAPFEAAHAEIAEPVGADDGHEERSSGIFGRLFGKKRQG